MIYRLCAVQEFLRAESDSERLLRDLSVFKFTHYSGINGKRNPNQWPALKMK